MGLQILLVEDNLQNQLLARTLLEKAGHKVTCVARGRLAFEELKRNNFDLALLDILLPEMDGYEIARVLKADERHRNLPLVALTSFAMPSERERAFAIGFDGYIEKPIDITKFVAQVVAHAKKENK